MTEVNGYQTTALVVIGPDEGLVTSAGEIESSGIALDVRGGLATVNGYVHTLNAFNPAASLNNGNLVVGSNSQARLFGKNIAIFASNGSTINNSGYVWAEKQAIVVSGKVERIFNSGTIESLQNVAITFNNGIAGTDRLELTNSGTIKAQTEAVLAGDTHDHVINSGRIETAGQIAVSLGGGNDIYEGQAGSTVTGKIDLGAGNDTACGGAGDEIFDGGADRDTYRYSGAVDLTIDLSITIAQATGQGNDIFRNFEDLWGGDGNDLLTGDAGANELQGGGGNDTILGGTGDDTLRGGTGSNLLEGGVGSDTLDGSSGAGVASYQHAAAPVHVNLSDWSLNTGDAAGDFYISVAGVWGSTHDDSISGNAGGNWFVGDDGNDIIIGGPGNDSLYGSAGDDLLIGDPDDDLIDGGEGVDTAVYTGGSDYSINLRLTAAQETGEGTDTLVGIENVTTGAGADRLTGNAQNNVFKGNGGNDTLVGGGGSDIAVFSGNKADYVITRNGNGTTSVAGPDGTDLLTGIRTLKFTDGDEILPNIAPDSIRLTSTSIAENTLPTTILATLSAHDADGDAVTFALTSNPGGFFALDDGKLILARALDFETQTQHTITIEATDAFGDRSSQTFVLSVTDIPDTDIPLLLRGTSAANTLSGASLNDILYGLGGNDRLFGAAGNDKLYGGVGKDVLTGGIGQDIFVFDTKPDKKTNIDKIVDFSVADDTIHLKKSVFSKIAKKGILAKDALYAGAAAHDASDRIIHNKKTGALFYDKDGKGGQAQIQIATLPTKLKVSHLDFFVM